MTIFEVITFNRELLARLSAAGIKPEDYRYLDLYNDFKEFVRRGEKVTYVVTVLADRYAVSERQVYKIVKRFDAAAPVVQ